MAIHTGADNKYKPVEQRVDTRPWGMRMAELWRNPEGSFYLSAAIMVGHISSFALPVMPMITSIAGRVLSQLFLMPTKKLHDLPFRMPETIDGYDGSEFVPDTYFRAKPEAYRPKGVTYYGRCLKSNEQVWASDDDDRTHVNIFGTTGSGKTELIFTIMVSQLIRNSGAIVVDAKGDIALYERSCNLLRRFGRDADLLCITFAIGSEDANIPKVDKKTNSFNLMLNSSSGMLTELLTQLLDGGEGGGDDVWKGRAIAFVGAMTQPLVFLRDRQEIELSPSTYVEFMELAEVERFVFEHSYDYDGFSDVLKPLRSFLTSLPGYNTNEIGNQAQQTNEQFGYITMQLTRSINDLGFTYGHIFGVSVGDIDITDIVLNRRFLIILLPSLQRSLPTLTMLGRLILGSIKQMMASSLGSTLEGNIRINIDSRPTNANNCFRIVLDEVGYMMVTGMSILPAQARSLNLAMVFAAQDYTDIERGSNEEAQAIWSNAAIKFVGKITAGEESEMWRRTRGMAGELEQMVVRDYERRFTATYDVAYRAGGSAQREKVSRLKYDEVASQTKGQFTLIAPKKYQGGMSGGIAAVPFQCMFTGDLPKMEITYVNDFVSMSTANINPPLIAKQQDIILQHLDKETLSTQMNTAVASTDRTGYEGCETANNSLSYLLYDIQKACEIQKDSDAFVNIMLEISLNKLSGAMQGLYEGDYGVPVNKIANPEKINDFYESDDVAVAVARDMDHASADEFNKIIEVQKSHLKQDDFETPDNIREAIDRVHKQGRAVDIDIDKPVKDLIDEYEDDNQFSFDDGIEDEFFDVKTQQKQSLVELAESIVLKEKNSIYSKVLYQNACHVEYIEGKNLDKNSRKNLIINLNNIIKK